MTDLALILGAVVLAAAGGEAFLKSIFGAAIHLRVPKIVVATTLAAFATSSPELTVSSVAALAGRPEIGLGDLLGSNVVNMALIFGLALLFGAVQTTRQHFGNSFALALATPVLTFVLVLDGRIERADALLLLAIFLVCVVWTVRCALRQREVAVYIEATELSAGKSLMLGVLGLGALIAAGRLFVSGATGVAEAFAVDTYVVGVVLVAVGTSLPELVTVILSRLRGQDDVGVGTLIGSNLFNELAIVGVAGTIEPIAAPMAVPMVPLVPEDPNRQCGRAVVRRWKCGASALLAHLPFNLWGLVRLLGVGSSSSTDGTADAPPASDVDQGRKTVSDSFGEWARPRDRRPMAAVLLETGHWRGSYLIDRMAGTSRRRPLTNRD